MKKISISLLLLLTFALSSFAQTYLLQVDKSTMTWTGKAAFNAYSLSGSLEPKPFTLLIDKGQCKTARLVVDMKTLEAPDKDLKKHLRSKDFFEVNKFPEATFELSQAFEFKEGAQILAGSLKVKDQTHPVHIPIELKKEGQAWKLSGKMIVDRTKYGIYYNSPNFFDKLKGQAIADEFTLDVELYFTQSPPQ